MPQVRKRIIKTRGWSHVRVPFMCPLGNHSPTPSGQCSLRPLAHDRSRNAALRTDGAWHVWDGRGLVLVCPACGADCLSICPGYQVDAELATGERAETS